MRRAPGFVCEFGLQASEEQPLGLVSACCGLAFGGLEKAYQIGVVGITRASSIAPSAAITPCCA